MIAEASNSSNPRVGIIVLNWNGWRDTTECLASLSSLTYDNFQVYVVDNASTDSSEAHLRARHPGLRVLQSGSNLGWSGGNNVGIRAALAEGCQHILLLNNDATVRPDTLDQLVTAARLPNAGALGSLILSADEPAYAEFAGTVIDPSSHFPRQISGPANDVDPAPAASIAVKGCSMLLTGAALAQVGLLPHEYFLNYDETDWCYRATAAGFINYLVPSSVVFHKGAVAFQGTATPLYRYFIVRNRLLFAHRNLDRVGHRFAWRTTLWEIKSALLQQQCLPRRALLLLAVTLGLVHYCLGRLGDCPSLVRRAHRTYLAT